MVAVDARSPHPCSAPAAGPRPGSPTWRTRSLILLAAVAVSGQPAHAIGPFAGVQTNVPVASLEGWTPCYSDTYGNSGTSLATIQAGCSQAHLLLGCRMVGSPDLLVAAHAPRADVLFDTGTGNTPHDANGVGWYYNDSHSWGFAEQGDPISRNSCDTTASSWDGYAGPNPDKRLCWHTGSGTIDGGWRCGDNIELNSNNSWERVVFQRDGFCNHDGVVDAGEDCDDANEVDADGCSECTIDECWNCTGEPSACAPASAGTACTPDDVFCTEDACDGAGACAHPDKADGTSCDDADACTQVDSCQAGSCTGADPYVCCDGGTCDPGTGVCATCPPGYTVGGGGCQKTYRIDSDAALDNLPVSCNADERYNDCSGAYGFHWSDTADAGVGAVTQVEVRIEAGLSCSAGPRGLFLNANPVGSLPIVGQCTCGSSHAPQLLGPIDPAFYSKGGLNTVLTEDPGDCEGLTQDDEGAYAVVTVTYEQLPGTPLDCDDDAPCTQDSCEPGDGCVHAEVPLDPVSCLVGLQSKLQIKDSGTAGKDKLSWQWSKGEAFDQASLGAPLESTGYTLCVYDTTASVSSLKASITVAASPVLWTSKDPKGLAYKDRTGISGGATKALIKTGLDGKTKVKLSAGGDNLVLPGAVGDTYFEQDPNVLVQLVNDEGTCWTSQFSAGDTKKNLAESFKAQVK